MEMHTRNKKRYMVPKWEEAEWVGRHYPVPRELMLLLPGEDGPRRASLRLRCVQKEKKTGIHHQKLKIQSMRNHISVIGNDGDNLPFFLVFGLEKEMVESFLGWAGVSRHDWLAAKHSFPPRTATPTISSRINGNEGDNLQPWRW